MTISFVIAGDGERPVSDREAIATRSLSMADASAVALTELASDMKLVRISGARAPAR
jgi:hypothetical protein